MIISYKPNGITMSETPSHVAYALHAVQLPNRKWWLPYNKQVLGRMWADYGIESAEPRWRNWKKQTQFKVDRKEYEYLREYQFEDLQKIITQKNHVNFSEPRVGKSVVTISWMKEKGLKKWIVVAPKSVIVLTWEQELQKWWHNVKVFKAYSSKNTLAVAKRKQVYKEFSEYGGFCVLLVSKDTIKLDVKDLKSGGYTNPKWKMNLLNNPINDFGLVLDEATFLKNYKTLQTKVLTKVSRSAEYTSCLTGTPTPKHPSDIYSIMHIIEPKVFSSFYNLANYYFGLDFWGKPHNSFKSEILRQEWIDWLSEFGVRHTQKEVLTWLPKVDKITIGVELDKQQKENYLKMKNTFTTESGDKVANVIAQFSKLKLIANSPYGTKTDFIVDYLEGNEQETVMIVSRYTNQVLAVLKEILQKKKIDCEIISGKTSLEDRLKIVNKVNEKKIQVLLANRSVIKEGIKLFGVDTLIWFDKGSTADNSQVEARFLPTDESEVTGTKRIISLVTWDSVDEDSEDQLVISNMLNEYLDEWGN